MPYYEITLLEYIDEHRENAGADENLSIAIQLCHALNYARQKGLIAHQDLKPENILLREFRKDWSLENSFR